MVHGGIKTAVALLRPPRWAPCSCLGPDPDRSRWVIAAALVATTGERQGSGYSLQEDGVLNGTDVAGGERLSLLWQEMQEVVSSMLRHTKLILCNSTAIL